MPNMFLHWAAKALTLLVATAFIAAVTQAAVVTENGYPIKWETAPQDLKAMTAADGSITINPWEFLQRMGMFRLLLTSTDQYMGPIGPSANDNPLWGLPLQLGWMLNSGRLADPTGASACGYGDPMCISPKSWWACVNYHLSVIPFLAAVKANVVGDGVAPITVMSPSEDAQDYCTNVMDCTTVNADMMSTWENFFETLKALAAQPVTDAEKRDIILSSMWAAQVASLYQASSTCSTREYFYSTPEQSFAKSWLNSVEYVSAAYFVSTLEKSEQFMSPLPSRVLMESDNPPNIPDLSAEENHTLYSFSWMNSINKLMGGTLVRMWKSAMCSDAAREKGRALLSDLVLNPRFAFSGLISILSEMATNC